MANILEEKLREAASLGDAEAVSNILSQNIDVNSQNLVNGWTALHWACKRGHEHIEKILLDYGADKNKKNFKGETPYDISFSANTNGQEPINIFQEESSNKYVPNYLRNPQIGTPLDIVNIKRSKHTDFSAMPTTILPSSPNDELVLKVKIHGSSDPDYIEVEIPRWKLTYNNLLKICCEELQISESEVERVRKLPDTRLRKDSDVRRLKEYHCLEIVLKPPVCAEKGLNCYQSISTCKNQTILY